LSIESINDYTLGTADRTHSPEVNPFAKKVEIGPPKAGLGIVSKKPAAVGPQKSLHKTETFFEKVEAAETSTDPPKREFELLILFSSVSEGLNTVARFAHQVESL
jgi:hypothetical protein